MSGAAASNVLTSRAKATGLITYMRTDSLRVAAEAQQEAMKYIGENLGPEYVPAEPNFYKSKKSSQDAHEAIRPSSAYRNLGAVKDSLDPDQFKIYSIIWKRFMASQSVPAVFDDTRVKISAGPYTLQANGSVKKFDGFMKLYDEEPKEQENGEQDADDGSQEQALLPELNRRPLSLLELKLSSTLPSRLRISRTLRLLKRLKKRSAGLPLTRRLYPPLFIGNTWTGTGESLCRPNLAPFVRHSVKESPDYYKRRIYS